MSGCTLADFDILIKGNSTPYSVTAFYGGEKQARRYSANGEFAPDILDPAWQAAYQTLGETLNVADADAIMDTGKRLWAALMQGEVRDLWVAARTDVEQGRVDALRLRLDLQPPRVAALPWESLYDPDRNIVFAAHPDFALVRVASLFSHVGRPRRTKVQLPLRVLIAAPDDPTGVINAQAEINEITQIMDSLGAATVQVETLTGDFTITKLRNTVAQFKPNILHFIGHGSPHGLKLWPRGRLYIAGGQSLRSILERAASVKLVVINACLTGLTARPVPFSGLADQLMQAGVPAVVAMQYQIRDHIAIDFAHFLYEELLGSTCPGIIDVAIGAARSGLYAANPGDFSFGTPVLWLNRADGSIFSLDSGEIEPSQETVDEAPAPTQSPTLDVDEENAWIDEMVASTDLERLAGEYAFLRSKWINYVNELRSLLLQISALAAQANSSVYEDKVADYRRFKAALLRVKRLIEEANPTS